MGEHSDPLIEVQEVIEKAKERVVYEAVHESDKRVGIAFAVSTPYKKFQPSYHLAYLAVHPKHRRSGVGKRLLEKIIEKTSGEISLHVNPENKNAISFYESLGFYKTYLRMTLKK